MGRKRNRSKVTPENKGQEKRRATVSNGENSQTVHKSSANKKNTRNYEQSKPVPKSYWWKLC